MVNGIMDVKVPEGPDLTIETERVYRGFRQDWRRDWVLSTLLAWRRVRMWLPLWVWRGPCVGLSQL